MNATSFKKRVNVVDGKAVGFYLIPQQTWKRKLKMINNRDKLVSTLRRKNRELVQHNNRLKDTGAKRRLQTEVTKLKASNNYYKKYLTAKIDNKVKEADILIRQLEE